MGRQRTRKRTSGPTRPLTELLAERQQLDTQFGAWHESVGPSLAAARASRGVSQTALARAAGVSTPYINMIESGVKPVNVTRLKSLLTLLDQIGETDGK